jgi:hypothetical protein
VCTASAGSDQRQSAGETSRHKEGAIKEAAAALNAPITVSHLALLLAHRCLCATRNLHGMFHVRIPKAAAQSQRFCKHKHAQLSATADKR